MTTLDTIPTIRPMGATKPTERLTIVLTPDELSDVEEFRFEKKFKNRNDAIRSLLKQGIKRKDEIPINIVMDKPTQ